MCLHVWLTLYFQWTALVPEMWKLRGNMTCPQSPGKMVQRLISNSSRLTPHPHQGSSWYCPSGRISNSVCTHTVTYSYKGHEIRGPGCSLFGRNCSLCDDYCIFLIYFIFNVYLLAWGNYGLIKNFFCWNAF